MPVNWKDPKAFERLLAAMVAAQEMKLDYRKIASMYGEGATYDAIEGRFRIIKKEASKLLAEVESGQRPEAPARGATTNKTSASSATSADDAGVATPKKISKSRSTTSTPRASKAAGDKVLGGRVSKNGKKIVAKTGMEDSVKKEEGNDDGMDMGVDVGSIVEGLGLDGNVGYEGSFDMEV
ncbi:MAG: hypothetical protein Q9169_006602 [Polycauliona sp. 2 TL-2023]